MCLACVLQCFARSTRDHGARETGGRLFYYQQTGQSDVPTSCRWEFDEACQIFFGRLMFGEYDHLNAGVSRFDVFERGSADFVRACAGAKQRQIDQRTAASGWPATRARTARTIPNAPHRRSSQAVWRLRRLSFRHDRHHVRHSEKRVSLTPARGCFRVFMGVFA